MSENTNLQVHIHGQWMLHSLMHSFVGQSNMIEHCHHAFIKWIGSQEVNLVQQQKRRRREEAVLHLLRWYTYTHTHTRALKVDVQGLKVKLLDKA